MSEIENFHAHVYYDAPTRAQALKLCEAAGQKFGVKVVKAVKGEVLASHPDHLTTARKVKGRSD